MLPDYVAYKKLLYCRLSVAESVRLHYKFHRKLS